MVSSLACEYIEATSTCTVGMMVIYEDATRSDRVMTRSYRAWHGVNFILPEVDVVGARTRRPREAG